MMHARSLVRRLLSLRKSGQLLVNQVAHVSQNFGGEAQPGADASLGGPSAIINYAGERHGQQAVVHPDFGKQLCNDGLDEKWVGNCKGIGPVLDSRTLNASFVGQLQGLPEGFNQHFAGQLPFKSSGGGR